MKTNTKQDIILFEEMASNAHVALNIMQYDGWILKFSEGHTNRANSVSMIYPSTISVNEKIQNCEKIYSEQNLPCVFKLTDGDEQMMKLLIERGYKEVTPSDVMVREIDDITMPEGDITFYNKPVEEWLCAYFEYEGFGQKSQTTYRRMLDKLCIKTDYLASPRTRCTSSAASRNTRPFSPPRTDATSARPRSLWASTRRRSATASA